MDGREPGEETEFEYDEDGRLARSRTYREPLWTEQDRAEVLALQLYRDSLCPCGCGLKAEDTLAPEESGPGFVVNQITCQARIVILEEQRAAAEKRGTENAAARLWSVDKKRR